MGRVTAHWGPAQAPAVRARARVADLGAYLGELRRRSLMQKNPKDRLNGQAAIKHPWIQTLSKLHQVARGTTTTGTQQQQEYFVPPSTQDNIINDINNNNNKMQGNPADELARHGEIVESLQSFSQARSINSRAVNSGG